MPKWYRVQLAPEEREQMERLIAGGTAASRTLTHARILLKADVAADPVSSNAEACAGTRIDPGSARPGACRRAVIRSHSVPARAGTPQG